MNRFERSSLVIIALKTTLMDTIHLRPAQFKWVIINNTSNKTEAALKEKMYFWNKSEEKWNICLKDCNLKVISHFVVNCLTIVWKISLEKIKYPKKTQNFSFQTMAVFVCVKKRRKERERREKNHSHYLNVPSVAINNKLYQRQR